MIITEIKKEHDDQSLDQLAELMMHLYGISLMGACGLLEKALDECQLTVGIFDRGRMLGVVFGKRSIKQIGLFHHYSSPRISVRWRKQGIVYCDLLRMKSIIVMAQTSIYCLKPRCSSM